MAMTMGRREYSEADMLRMQRDAEERVREMQARARETVEQDNMNSITPRNRNWSSGGGMRRPGNRRPQPADPRAQQRQQPEPPETPEPEPPQKEDTAIPEEQKKTTIVEDVMKALSLDEDYLLIIGLLLIMLNQRADTTLILALAYILI